MKFASLDMAEEILKALKVCGYSRMTPVQQKAIIPARQGRDLFVNAQTGTGKTAAFALPILQQMHDKAQINSCSTEALPKALILTPTRELAEQLAQTIRAYAQFLEVKIVGLFGGVKVAGQSSKLKSGVDILISTPARLLEHLSLNHVNLSAVEYLVLDEADRMLDMGFIADVTQITSYTAKKHQTMLFSATTTPAMNELSHQMLNNHLDIRVTKTNSTAETVEHVLYPVEEGRKIDLFMTLLEQYNWFQILVFTSTKKQADDLLHRLKKHKIEAAICHGDKTQGARRRALADFKAAKLQVLVATEVAARGIDIVGLDYVLNYHLPFLPEDYVHRIGRTGRAGQQGHAISFVSREEEHMVRRIERLIGGDIKRVYQKGFEVSERSTLRKAIARKPQKGRYNKASETAIGKNRGISHKKTKKASKRKSAKKSNKKK